MAATLPPKLFVLTGWACDFRTVFELSAAIGWRGLTAPVETTRIFAGAQSDAARIGPPLENFIAGFKERKTILAGWSLGSLVAMRIALAHPELIEGLILISPTARMTSDGGYPGADPRSLRAMRRRLVSDPLGAVEDFHRLAFAPKADDERTAEIARRVTEPMMGGLAEGLDYLASEDLRGQVSRIETPCLIVHGMEDRVVPAACGRWLSENLADCRSVFMPGEGHMLPLTAAPAIAANIRDFLNDRIR